MNRIAIATLYLFTRSPPIDARGVEAPRPLTGSTILAMRRFASTLLAALLIGAAPGFAQTPPSNSLGLPIDPALLSNLPELKGVVSWSTLGQVKAKTVGARVLPEFTPQIIALDQRDVKLQGFMMPIVAGETHDHFLLTMRPADCPFCLSVGPEYIVEVRAAKPLKYTFEPIVLAGKFAVLADDPFGLYYRLTLAQLSSAPRQ
jgi:hypothetical protein